MPSSAIPHSILMLAYTYYESDPRVIREAEAAADAGFTVDFLALRRPGTAAVETLRGVRVIRVSQAKYRGSSYASYLWAYTVFFLRCLFLCTRLFFTHRYNVIHVNNMPDFLVFSTLIPKLFGVKVILDIHDPMPNTFASKFKGRNGGLCFQLLLWQERLSAAYATRVITVHEPVKNGILMKHGLRSDAIDVIANFADDTLFPLQKSYGLNGRIRFVFHGTILERSGLRILMDALGTVRNRHRIAVRIIGEGDFSGSLKDLIARLKLEDIVEFNNKSYPAHTLAELLCDCHVGLVPLEVSSATDYALPLKLGEYISLGLPVLTVRNEAIAYYLNEDDCIFYRPNSSESLSSALDRIAANPEVLYGYRNRSIALRPTFSWQTEKTKYVALLNRLAGAA